MSFVHRSRRAGRLVTSAAVAGACLVVTACGSTVQLRGTRLAGGGDGISQGTAQGLGGSGASTVSGSSPGGSALGANGGATGGGSAVSAGSGGGVAIGPGGSAAGGGNAGSSSSTGPLAPATFKIGIQYTSNGGAAVSVVSGGSFNGDARGPNNAVIGWINKHGGVGGRPAAPVYNNIDATANPTTQSQAACTQWTQDDHVALAIPTSAVEDMDLMRECLGRARVPALMGYVASRTLRSSFASSPLWFENGTLSLEDYAQTYVHGLARQGFFSGGKIGVVYYDRAPFTTALNSDLIPALHSVGVSDVATFGASIDGASTLGTGSQEMSSAVLSFRSKGVTKVLFFEPWIGYFEFLNNAKSQNYHPTYGLSSQEGPQLAEDLKFAPADQLANARIVTWNPMTDVHGYQPYTGPRLKLCTQIFRDAGVALGTDQTGFWGQMLACENLLLVQDAYRAAPRQVSAADFGRGMEALGANVASATRLGGAFAANKHWATSKYWAGHFDSALSTFVLDGSPQDVS